MLPSLGGVFLGRSTRSGHIFSPYSAVPYSVPGIDIYDFIHREEEHHRTRELDESLVELEPDDLVPIVPIDLNLDLQLLLIQPIIHKFVIPDKRRATPSAATHRPLPNKPPAIPPCHPPTPASSKWASSKPAFSTLPAGNIIRIPRKPASSTLPAGNTIRIPRNKNPGKTLYHRDLRRLHRAAESAASPSGRKKITSRRTQQSTPIFTAVDISHLRHTSTAWLGVRMKKPAPRPYILKELRDDLGMDYLGWDGRSCRPLIDAKNRVFALLAGRPKPDQDGNDSYAAVIEAANKLFAQQGAAATGDGRRGPFVAVSTGESYGGGQKRPGNLLNNSINAAICTTMLSNWAIRRLAGFANGMFQSFAPTLHAFYAEQHTLLHISAPFLRRIFAEAVSVFAACTFNFGPSTVTLPHVGAANLAWGWCAITALGYFNPDLGGHLILWDLNLIIRFPPGSTILIPSALLRHSNVAIQQGETRYSFTQFTAGGLFRWTYNGNQSDADFYRSATAEQLRERDADKARRWEEGLKMFMVWNEKTGTFENDQGN